MRNQRLEQLKSIHMGVNPKIGVFTPQNGWFIRENHLFLETPIWDRLSFQRKLPCKDMHEGHQVRSANPEETDPAMYPPNKP